MTKDPANGTATPRPEPELVSNPTMKMTLTRRGLSLVARDVLLATISAGITLSSRAAAQTPDGRAPGTADSVDWRAVDSALGRKGTMQPGSVYKFSLPRGDLHVTVGRVVLRPALALGSWVAFTAVGRDALMMGDLVLIESEVRPVLGALATSGIAYTAMHNHLLGENPHVIYVHVHARGDAVQLARSVRHAVSLTRTPAEAPAPIPPAPLALDTAKLHQAVGYSGKANGGVYQISVPRATPIRDDGVEIPPAMGVATALNFQSTGSGRAAATGDFVLTADEVDPVRTALQAGGVTVTALHTHLIMEEPRLYFMHFWADTDAVALGHTLASALGRMKVKSPGS